MSLATKKVVIVGGGPAGAAAAIALAKQGGFSVELYESYAHPKRVTKNSPIAYVIALGSRGQEGIRNSTGIDPLTEIPDAIVSTCIVRHPSGTLMKHEDRPSLIVPRQVLTAYLLDQAVAAGVSVHFEKRLIDVDFESRTAVFEPSDTTAQEKRRTQAKYDLLIGADGSESCVRCLLESRKNDFVVRREKDSMEYQVVVLPKSPFPDLPSKAVHAWNNKQYNAICLGFPLANDGAMLMVVVFPEGKLASFKSSGYKHALSGHRRLDTPRTEFFCLEIQAMACGHRWDRERTVLSKVPPSLPPVFPSWIFRRPMSIGLLNSCALFKRLATRMPSQLWILRMVALVLVPLVDDRILPCRTNCKLQE